MIHNKTRFTREHDSQQNTIHKSTMLHNRASITIEHVPQQSMIYNRTRLYLHRQSTRTK